MQLLILIASALAAPIVRTLPASVGTINLDIPRGELVVLYDEDATATRLTVTPLGWRAGCGLQLTGDHHDATARVIHDSGLAGLGCRSRVELVLAGPTTLSARVTAGNITTAATSGHQQLRVGTGRVGGSMGEGSVRVDQGRVNLSGLTEGLDVNVSVGHIQLTYATPPRGPLTAHADMGNVIVTLPAGSAIDPHIKASLGMQELHFPVGDGVSVSVESRVGNARLLADQGSTPDSESSQSTSAYSDSDR
jgi:hypothetical protein